MSTVLDKWDKRFLDLSELAGSWSKDPSTKVGSVIVDQKKRIVSLGFNGSPRGVEDAEERSKKLLRTVHSEMNSLHFANRDVEGCTIYITHPPCANCASHLIQRGVRRVVFYRGSDEFLERWGDNYREALSMFREAHVEVCEVIL